MSLLPLTQGQTQQSFFQIKNTSKTHIILRYLLHYEDNLERFIITFKILD